MPSRKRTFNEANTLVSTGDSAQLAPQTDTPERDNKRRRTDSGETDLTPSTETVTTLRSQTLGSTQWKLRLIRVDGVSQSSHSYNCASLIFRPKLSDWNDYIVFGQRAFLAILEDDVGIWRSAAWFYILDTQDMSFFECEFLVKIVLTATDLHYRRQKLGSLTIDFITSSLPEILETDQFSVVALVMSTEIAQAFWRRKTFVSVDRKSTKKIEEVFGNEREGSIDVKMLVESPASKTGRKPPVRVVPVALQNQIRELVDRRIREFERPTYVDYGKRYARADEIEKLENDQREGTAQLVMRSTTGGDDDGDSDFSCETVDESEEFESESE